MRNKRRSEPCARIDEHLAAAKFNASNSGVRACLLGIANSFDSRTQAAVIDARFWKVALLRIIERQGSCRGPFPLYNNRLFPGSPRSEINAPDASRAR